MVGDIKMNNLTASDRKKMRSKIDTVIVRALKKNFPDRFIVGFDDCVVGVGSSYMGFVVLYSEKRIIEKLMKKMSYGDAIELFESKMLATHMSECPPVFLIDETLDKTKIL